MKKEHGFGSKPSHLVVAITPFELPDTRLALALAQTEALAVLDLGDDAEAAREALGEMGGAGRSYGVRLCESCPLRPGDLPANVGWVILPASRIAEVSRCGSKRVLVQVVSVEEAIAAGRAGAHGLIAKGCESGGRIGEESAFVLLQHLRRATDLPVWVQGGIGLHTAAACVAGGAAGVVVDSQLACLHESSLFDVQKKAIRAMDGSESKIVEGRRIASLLGFARNEVPAGQDVALAGLLARRFSTARDLVEGIGEGISAHIGQAKALRPLASGSPLAREHGLPYPVVQGPMSRVSDRASFADAVSSAGGLPLLGLALLRGDELASLLRETAERLGDKAWGVGILGFAPQELRDEQLEAIAAVRPKFALIAGGRPAQARPLEEMGIATYLHVPSPGLLDLFLQDGARRFVFEGRECGGHVGPRTSFTLWEAQIERLLEFEAPREISVLFAGGIHDARSAAMVSTLAAPLAARGVRVGVLMGTAYLFTEEAVSTGAILPGFQQAALGCNRTTLLETAPGHATRCVESDYVQAFHERRKALETEGKSPEETWQALEEMNLGRLRIASKGVRRVGRQSPGDPESRLEAVDAETQRAEGLYMAGQVAALRDEVCTMDQLHREVTEGACDFLDELAPLRTATADRAVAADVAIIGMACIYPDSPDLDSYWANIVSCHDAISEVDPERWNPEIYYDPESRDGTKTNSKWGGFLPNTDFDPLPYGIPPRSLAAIEPIQLLSLEVARRALQDAGYSEREFPRNRTAVIFGAESGTDLTGAHSFRALYPKYLGELPAELDAVLPTLTEDSFPGVLANIISGRIANRLDLGGANYTVDAACASSLAAVDIACKELVTGSSDMVLCGGADLHNSIQDFLMFSSVHVLSPHGQCRTFDGSANGIVLGEGIAVVVLKRLSDAERDGDRVYAVIKGIAGSGDGRSDGITVPQKEGQVRVLEQAYTNAGVSPRDVGMVEAHGTGTVLGDRNELATLTDVYTAAGVRPGRCALGSVKSQIGHTKCAAGLAGLVKTALALHHRTLPPTLHVKTPNPGYDEATSPFTLHDAARPWFSERPHAAVSAFGFGGTNFHAVLQAHDASTDTDPGLRVWPTELFLFRGTDRSGALSLADQVLELLDGDAPVRLRDLAHTVARSGQGPVWYAVVASDTDDLREKLVATREGREREDVFVRSVEPPGRVAFLFPGQGSQRPNMLADLFVAFPALRDLLDLGDEWRDVLFPPTAYTPEARAGQREALANTRVAQPVMGIADLAMADLLAKFGVRPDMLAGHSYGELVALCVAGALSRDELLPLSEARGRSILEAAGENPGTMVAVRASAVEVQRWIQGTDVVCANHNAPDQTVISGPTASVEAATRTLEENGFACRPIPVSCAFHSPVVAGAKETFGAELEAVPLGTPDLQVWSNTTAGPYPAEPDAIRATLGDHLASPVRFIEQIENMHAAGARIFVEAGPGRVLSGLVRKILGDRPHTVIPCEEPGHPGITSLLAALARLAVNGVPLDTEALFAGRSTRPFDLDAPPERSPTVWRINGHRAVPLRGQLPEFAMHPITQPVRIASQPSTAATTGSREAVVLEYLKGMRDMIRTQREVMLRYLGATPAEVALPAEVPVLLTDHDPVHSPAPAGEMQQPAPSQDVGTVLMEIVSERTGYPVEILDLDLDLAADLSIDSIKRIEILGELSKRMGLGQGDVTRRDEMIEELASKKTLRSILGWLEDQRGDPEESPEAPPAEEPAQAPRPAEPGPDLPAGIRRYVLSVEPAPAVTFNGRTTQGKTFAVTEDGRGIAEVLADHLRRNGARVHVLKPDESPGRVDGLVHLASLTSGPGSCQVKHLFSLAQESLLGGASWVLAATGFGGTFGRGAHPDQAYLRGGISGMLKTVAKEFPDSYVRVVDLDPDEPPERIAEAIYNELLANDDLVEVGYRQGTRHVLRPVAADPDQEADLAELDLSPGAVVLLTGGARGITAHVARSLASRFRPHLVLVGRSPLEPEERDPEIGEAPDQPALRRVLIGRGMKPAAIEVEIRRILAAREVRQTLDQIRASGAEVEYHQVDVRDSQAFGDFIDDCYARHGRIDGVIHGAGVLEDKLLRHKTVDSFNRVFDTKVVGALTLAQKLRDDVRFVVFFSSVSGAFGNRGQVDYSAANDALDKLAISMNARLPGRVVSINWGPWAGTGMVSSELEAEYARQNIGVIPPGEGAESLIAEIGRAGRGDAQVILMRAKPEHFC